MPILIDGHNLIGAGVFPDIRLADEDDEAKLVARLKVWKSRYKGKITVIFDRGIPGGVDHKLGGAGVEVVFAADPRQADDLIRRRLHRPAHGLILVTNDDALRRAAGACQIPVWSGAEFVQRLSAPTLKAAAGVDAAADDAGAAAHVKVTEAEVEEWLALFAPAKRKRLGPRKRPLPPSGQPPAGQ